MPAPVRTQAGTLLARVLAILHSPRTTFEALALAPRALGVITLTFLVTAGCTAIVLETDVGQLALLDHWERMAFMLGQTVDDVRYRAMEDASRHGTAYAALIALVSGPVLTVGLSGLCFALLRAPASSPVTYRQVLAIAGHAGVILALRQVIAAPLTYARETLASPMTIRLFFTMRDEASLAARFFETIDFFVIWWIVVLAVGMSVLYRRPARRLAYVLVGAYVTLSSVVTIVMAIVGGTA